MSTPTPSNPSFLTKVGGFSSTNGAEIPAFDPLSDRLFVVAGNTIEILDLSNPAAPSLSGTLTPGFTAPTGTALIPNSVAVKNGVVAVAYAIRDTTTGAQQIGKVAFFSTSGTFLNAVNVGALPDMLTFTSDGTKVLVANEGEPNSYNQTTSFDPEGSVSVIDVSGGVGSATVQTADFSSFNGQIATLRASGIRIFGPNATVAQDLEPEYIAVSADGQTALVTLQENNAIALLDINTATITQILPLGVKDHSLLENGLDASDRDLTSSTGKINIQNWPVVGLYQPDAIASFTANGQTYYITANEGDARDYPGFAEEVRVGASSYVLDPTAFPNAATLKNNANLGRLTVTSATGKIDGDADFDRIEVFGARSFSILDSTGKLVYDSGDDLERITADTLPANFNANNDSSDFDSRSDNKGPEPEGVVTAKIHDRTYAFVGLERIGGIITYDVTTPTAPTFVQYFNSRNFSASPITTPGNDSGPEGLIYVSAADSPNGRPLVITANEVSNSVAVYEIAAIKDSNGTTGRDTLTGTADRDRLIGGLGGDALTGGTGADEFVYTNIRDAGDRITDFIAGQDQIVLTQLLDSLVAGGYSGTNAIADGYVRVIAQGNSSVVQIDQDGSGLAATFRSFITLDHVAIAVLNNPSNFVF